MVGYFDEFNEMRNTYFTLSAGRCFGTEDLYVRIVKKLYNLLCDENKSDMTSLYSSPKSLSPGFIHKMGDGLRQRMSQG